MVISTFYNGPTPPPGVFDDFIALPSISDDTSGPRGMVPIVKAGGSAFSSSSRCVFSSLYMADTWQMLTNKACSGSNNLAPIEKPSPAIVNAIVNETIVRAAVYSCSIHGSSYCIAVLDAAASEHVPCRSFNRGGSFPSLHFPASRRGIVCLSA